TYIAYAYVESRRPDLRWLWPVIQAGNQLDRPQKHVSLDDFESMYMALVTDDSGDNNYGWYQGQIFEQVKKVYQQHGLAFLKLVRAEFPADSQWFALGNQKTLEKLERISPGFIGWSRKLEANSRRK
ncbi:MAG TPA: hypothetical protein VKJ65_07370, partial [Phycisphaerae bacterium]|nr:hypothetical protein [Phycisphaerae bacterium]